MPTLNWIGKDKVVNHHLDVPYRILDKRYTFGNEDNGNMIIHGDNLEALKALLPRFEGQIKCIYIDPPYNTGNENWAYNDNVNDPRIRKWLGEVVGSEGEDLSRHDKWLCMMYPRLRLLHRLLAPAGVIFISIDDREQPSLRLICNEIFGTDNFLAQFVWQKRTSPDMRKAISTAHEYICAYCRDISMLPYAISKIPLREDDASGYSNPDNDPRGPWASTDFTAQGYRPNQMYEIVTPGGARYTPPAGRCWTNVESEFLHDKEEGRMWFGSDGNSVPRRKTYLSERDGRNSWTWLDNKTVGHTQEAKKEVKNVFLTPDRFEYPKPTRLIERLLLLAAPPGSIVLDSFAGSGTTAHAVLAMNNLDGGNRRFILVEMEDYAESITAERVRRVITGVRKDREVVLYDEEITTEALDKGPDMLIEAKRIAKDAKSKYGSVKKPKVEEGRLRVVAVEKAADQEPGTGGGFSYYELGEPLLVDGNLNENVGADKIREYIWFSETATPFTESQEEPTYYLGTCNDTDYWFVYERDRATTLDSAIVASLPRKGSTAVVYADLCTLSGEEMIQGSVVFKKIPRDIRRI